MPSPESQAPSDEARHTGDALLALAHALRRWADDLLVRASLGHAEDALERVRATMREGTPLSQHPAAVAEAQERAAARAVRRSYLHRDGDAESVVYD